MTLKGCPREATTGFCPTSAPTLFLEGRGCVALCSTHLPMRAHEGAHVSSATFLTRGHLLQLVCRSSLPPPAQH